MAKIVLKCPGCGSPVEVEDGQIGHCEFCQNPVPVTKMEEVRKLTPPQTMTFISSCNQALAAAPKSQTVNSALGMCFLKLKMYDKAWANFDKIIDDFPTNPETYFWAAVSLLKGKKAFLALRPTIDKILEYVQAACMLEDKGIYHYFLAYIKYDYFARKSYNVSPNWKQEYNNAVALGCTKAEANELFEILNVQKPDVM